MTWVLLFWLINANGNTVASAEFNSRKACVDAALGMQRQWGLDFGFQCVEKGKPAK